MKPMASRLLNVNRTVSFSWEPAQPESSPANKASPKPMAAKRFERATFTDT